MHQFENSEKETTQDIQEKQNPNNKNKSLAVTMRTINQIKERAMRIESDNNAK